MEWNQSKWKNSQIVTEHAPLWKHWGTAPISSWHVINIPISVSAYPVNLHHHSPIKLKYLEPKTENKKQKNTNTKKNITLLLFWVFLFLFRLCSVFFIGSLSLLQPSHPYFRSGASHYHFSLQSSLLLLSFSYF